MTQEEFIKDIGYEACRNCKYQIEPLRMCEWAEKGGDGKIHILCPRWEKKGGTEMVHDATCKDWAEAGKEIGRGIHDAVQPKDEDETWKDDMQRDADAYFESGGEP